MSVRRVTPELARELRAITERTLSLEDFEAIVRAPMSDDERTGILENVTWFTTRYPTPAARLAYVRRAYARWIR